MALPSWLQREQSFTVRAAAGRVNRADLDKYLKSLGSDGAVARDLDQEVDPEMARVTSLSSLTSPLAVAYMDRLARPVPSLTPEIGVLIVGRTYVAHMVVERDPGRFGAADVPVLGTLPPLKKGRPPQDLLIRVVKVSRGRSFSPLCALAPAAWDGFVRCLTKRAHDAAAPGAELVSTEVVDGVARFAWILRQVDLHYGLSPERS
ncbi:MAG TPA: hypothetical protein VFH58_15600 [Acidimicrobiales bacterium]|nr:hypothetical protein [Acidimicrobiales bacterium]